MITRVRGLQLYVFIFLESQEDQIAYEEKENPGGKESEGFRSVGFRLFQYQPSCNSYFFL